MDMVILAIGDESIQVRLRLMRLHIAAMDLPILVPPMDDEVMMVCEGSAHHHIPIVDLAISLPPIEPLSVMQLRSLMEDTILWSDVEVNSFKVRKKPNWTRDCYMSSNLSDTRAQAFLARQQVRTTRRSGSRHRERPRILLEAPV